MSWIGDYRKRAFNRKTRHKLRAIEFKDKIVRIEHLQEWQALKEAQNKEWEQVLDVLAARLELLEGRLEDKEGQLIYTIQQFRVSQWLLSMMIGSDPKPEVLLRNWQINLPELIDGLTEEIPPNGDQQEYTKAWQSAIEHFTQMMEQSVANRKRSEDD